MILEIDVGNSRIKWRLRDDSGRLASGFSARDQLEQLAEELRALGARPARVWVACVLSDSYRQSLLEWSRRHWGLSAEFALSVRRAAGVTNAYRDADRLGVDRWLALLAAHARSPEPAVIVQVGTAVTVDLLGPAGVHLGGYIGPGWRLMREALQGRTAQVTVELAAPEQMQLTPGTSTEQAVEAALSAMLLGLVERAERRLQAPGSGPPRVLLSGGDARLLRESWPAAHWWPEIVLDGLQLALERPPGRAGG